MFNIESLYNTSINPIRPVHVLSRRNRPKHERKRETAWTFGGVVDRPQYHLTSWSALDVLNFGSGNRCQYTTHLVGRTESGHSHCFSTELDKFDPRTRRGQTKNGTIYELVGDADPWGEPHKRFLNWTQDRNIHPEVFSTDDFVEAIAAAGSTRYTVAMALKQDEKPVPFGFIDVKAHGPRCDATFVGKAWSDEEVTLRIENYPRGAEPISCLLVRLLQQVPGERRVSSAGLTDCFDLGIYFGDSTDLRAEYLGIDRSPHTAPSLQHSSVGIGEASTRLLTEEFHPLDCLLQHVPLLWPEYWDQGMLTPLNQYPQRPATRDDFRWQDLDWEYQIERGLWNSSFLEAETCVDDSRMHPYVAGRYFAFFRGAWGPKSDCLYAIEEWRRFLVVNGVLTDGVVEYAPVSST